MAMEMYKHTGYETPTDGTTTPFLHRKTMLENELAFIAPRVEEELKEKAEKDREETIISLTKNVMELDLMAEEILAKAKEMKVTYDNIRLKAAEVRAQLLNYGVRIDPHDPSKS